MTPFSNKPKVYTFGGYAADELEDRFQLYYKAQAVDKYWVYLKINGWGSCGTNVDGGELQEQLCIGAESLQQRRSSCFLCCSSHLISGDHLTEVVITSSDENHDYDDTDTWDEAAYTLIEVCGRKGGGGVLREAAFVWDRSCLVSLQRTDVGQLAREHEAIIRPQAAGWLARPQLQRMPRVPC
jgi:hypothetical protein